MAGRLSALDRRAVRWQHFGRLNLLALGLLAACAAGCARSSHESSPLKLGVIQPLSGDLGNFGRSVLEGVRLAVEDQNAVAPHRPVSLAVEDSQGAPKLALSALLKLRDVDRVSAVVGPLTSGEARSLLSSARTSGMVMISPTASTPSLSGASPFFFRVWPSDVIDGRIAADYALRVLNARRVGVLCVNNDFGVGLKQVFERNVAAGGGSVVFSDAYPEDTADFRTVLQVIASRGAAVVYLPGHPRGIATILRQARELRMDTRFMSNVAGEDRDFLQLAGDAAVGLVFTAPTLDLESDNAAFASFRKRYKERMDAEPDAHAAKGYDAAAVLISALRAGNTNGEAIGNYLRTSPEFSFVSGPFRFDDDGDIVCRMAVKSYLRAGETARNIAIYDPAARDFRRIAQ